MSIVIVSGLPSVALPAASTRRTARPCEPSGRGVPTLIAPGPILRPSSLPSDARSRTKVSVGFPSTTSDGAAIFVRLSVLEMPVS